MNSSTRAVPALLAALLLGGCGGAATPAAPTSPSTAVTTTTTVDKAAEEQAVRKAFEDYKAALRAKDGKAAVKVVSDQTLGMYLEFKEMALTMPEDQVRRLGATTGLLIYSLRAEFGAAELRGMTSADLVATAVSKGLISERSVEVVELGTVTVDGDKATAEMTSRGQAAGVELPFHKEFGSWKFDALAVLTLADEAFALVAEQLGLPVDQVVDETLARLYGADRVPRLKQPLEG